MKKCSRHEFPRFIVSPHHLQLIFEKETEIFLQVQLAARIYCPFDGLRMIDVQNALGFIDENRIDIKLAGTCHSSGFPGLKPLH